MNNKCESVIFWEVAGHLDWLAIGGCTVPTLVRRVSVSRRDPWSGGRHEGLALRDFLMQEIAHIVATCCRLRRGDDFEGLWLRPQLECRTCSLHAYKQMRVS